MFKRAIVLSGEELKSLISDFVEVAKEEFVGKDDLVLEELEEFLAAAFEEVLDVYGVDQAMVHLDGGWVIVVDGKSFVSDVVKKVYQDLNELLSEVKGVGEGN